MDFFDAVERRYSARAYHDRAVEDWKLERVLAAAIAAPTACNLQPFRLIVVPTAGHGRELERLYPRGWFADAPIVIGITSVPSEAWSRRDGKNYADVDATIAMDHLVLAATALDLGTCWVAAFDPVAAREILRLPTSEHPLAFTPLGYPADRPGPRTRRARTALVRHHRWA